jgi:rhamnosyltransferase
MTPTPDSPADGAHGIYAVLVTYNPDPACVASLAARLRDQVERLLVIDNGSANGTALAALCATLPAVTLLALASNTGIAHAQNAGVALARREGARYIVYFDQDSTPPAGFVTTLRASFDTLSARVRVAATVPVFRHARDGFYYPLILLRRFGLRTKIVPDGAGGAPFVVSMAISSGTFTSLAVLDDVGPMRDDFFIDYVDTEWCLRALARGYTFYAVPGASMLHAIGDHTMPFLRWRVPVHTAARRYYRIRNGFYMLRLAHVPLLLGLREIGFNCVHQVLMIATQRPRGLQLRVFARAVLAGLGRFQG